MHYKDSLYLSLSLSVSLYISIPKNVNNLGDWLCQKVWIYETAPFLNLHSSVF